MRTVLIPLLLLWASPAVWSQSPPKPTGPIEVDTAEVLRRGDLVEHVSDDKNTEDPVVGAIASIAETPESDVDKWFISVVGQKKCVACEKLKKQWETDPTLRAFAVPESPKDSWAHFTMYDYDDPMQAWRWKVTPKNPRPVKIEAFPTVIVTPPRSGKYGNPSHVVLKWVYDGEPEHFKAKVNGAIKLYLQKLQERRNAVGPENAAEPRDATGKRKTGFGAPSPVKPNPNLEAPPAVKAGWGQDPFHVVPAAIPSQVGDTVPPLALPLDAPGPEPSAESQPGAFPLLRALAGGRPELIVVYDRDQTFDPREDAGIARQVNTLQTGERPYKVRYLPFEKAGKAYGIAQEELPVVLQVDGRTVRSKLSAVVDQDSDLAHKDKGFFVGTIAMLLGGMMAFSTAIKIAHVIWNLFLLVLFLGVVLFGVMLLLLLVRRNPQPSVIVAQPSPASAPAAVPPPPRMPSADEIAAAIVRQQQAARPAPTA